MPDTTPDTATPMATDNAPPFAPTAPTFMPDNAPPPAMPNSAPPPEATNPDYSGTIPSQTPYEYTPGEQQYHESRGRRILDVVGGILGGNETWKVTRNPQTGEVSAEQMPSALGEKWGRVAAAALGGAAQGLANSQGPGGLARAAAAGMGYGLQQPEKAKEEAQQQVSFEQDRQMKQANHVLLDQKIAQGAAEAEERPTRWANEQLQFRLATMKAIDEMGAEFEGHTASMKDIATLGNANPDAVDHHTGKSGGNLIPVPNPQGGLDWYSLTADAGNKRTITPFTYKIAKLDPDHKGKVIWEDATDEAGGTNKDRSLKIKGAIQANNETIASAAQMEAELGKVPSQEQKTADLGKTKAETREANARAGLASAQAEMTRQQSLSTVGSPADTLAGLIDSGQMAPSQLKRGVKGAPDPNTVMALASQRHLARTGTPLSLEDAENNYRAQRDLNDNLARGTMGQQITSFNTFLGHAEELSDSINQLRNTNVPLLNMPLNQLRQKIAGNPSLSYLLPQIEAVRTEYQNFLNNNHALHEDDIHEGKGMLNENQTLAQAQAAMKAFASTAVVRTANINNQYKRFHDGQSIPELLSPQSLRAVGKLGASQVYNDQILGQYGAPQQPQIPPGAAVQAPPRPQGIPADYIYKQGPRGWGYYNPNPQGQ